MLITFPCKQCQSDLEVDANAAGQQVKCPQCGTLLEIPKKLLGPGMTVGGFEIKRLLGSGAMGEVYLARQISLDRDVALKILPSHLKLRGDLAERFFKETRLMAKLEHPHIVGAYEAGEDGGVLYLAMAYVEGESLDQRIAREGVLKEKEALAIVEKAAKALAYAWNKFRLLHRDIKPANILLDKEGEPKLADLGLAKSLVETEDLTLTRAVMGTPNYMSPEQTEGSKDLDFRADMYGLGTTLYHMVTGKIPFAGSSVLETLRKQAMEDLPDPRESNPELTENLVALMEVMLAKDAKKRYQSWEALIGDMERVQAGRPPTGVPLAPGESVLLRAGDLKPRIKAGSKPAPKRSGWQKYRWPILAGAAAVMVAGIVTGFVLSRSSSKPSVSSAGVSESVSTPLPVPASAPAVTPVAQATPSPAAQQAYGEALEYEREHRGDYAGAIGKYEAASRAGEGTEYKVKALEAIQRLEGEKKQAIATAQAALKQETERRVAAGKYEEALQALEKDSGPLAGETAGLRTELAAGVKAKQAEALEKKALLEKEAAAQQVQAAQAKLGGVLDNVAGDLLKGDYAGSVNRLKQARGDADLAALAGELDGAKEFVLQVAGMPELIAGSFEREKGKEVEVEFKDGRVEKVKVAGVEGEKVSARREIAQGYVDRSFLLSDLSVKEKIKRLGAEQGPAYGVMRGLLAAEGGDWAGATSAFQGAGNKTGEALARAAGKRQGEQMEAAARQALGNLLRAVGAAEGADAAAVLAAVRAKGFTAGQMAKLQGAAAEFQKRYGETATGREKAEILAALGGSGGGESPAPKATEGAGTPVAMGSQALVVPSAPPKSTVSPAGSEKAANPAAEKAAQDALVEILKLAGVGTDLEKSRELRMAIAGKGYPEEEGEKIREAVAAFEKTHGQSELARRQWRLLDYLKQASPEPRPPLLQATEENLQRALEDLERDNPQAAPIKPSQALVANGLINLNLYRQENVVNISALEGLPYGNLSLGGTSVSDITPLTGNPAKSLNLPGCPVKDFTPIKSMKSLTSLSLEDTRFSDLSQVVNENLTDLRIRNTAVSDLQPLKGLKLTLLYIGNTKVKDISALAGMPLGSFMAENCEISDLSPLADVPLKGCRIGNPRKPLDMSSWAGKKMDGIGLYYEIVSFAPFQNIIITSLSLGYPKWAKTPKADQLPVYLPDLESLITTYPGKEEIAIILKFPHLKQVHVGSDLMSFDEFKKRFGPKGK